MEARKAKGIGEMRLGRRAAMLAAALSCTAVFAPTVASAATISASGGAITLADNFANDSVCSLREMVAIANGDDAGIELDCTVNGTLGDDTINLGHGLYQLSIPLGDPSSIGAGDLEVEDTVNADAGNLKIIGLGSANTLIDGGAVDRVFEAGGGTFRLEELAVQNGQVLAGTNGGGILSSAAVQLEGVVVRNNATVSGGNGGGIFMSGTSTLTLSNSTVEANVSSGTGGGIELRQSASLTTQGAATIGGDDPGEGNTAASQGGGINMSTPPGGDIDLNEGASVSNNNAVGLGGGISHTTGTAGSDLTLNETSVDNNDVGETVPGLASGGGIHYVGNDPSQVFSISQGSTINNNTATGDEATGAGINATLNQGTFSITDSFINANATNVQEDMDDPETAGGGGLTLTGTGQATLTGTTVRDNLVDVDDPEDVAVGGGILDNGKLTIDASLLAGNGVQGGNDTDVNGNQTPRGAALFASSAQGPVQVINSTFTVNVASPGIGASSFGAGIVADVTTNELEVAHSTFTGNSATAAKAIMLGGTPNASNLTLRGSIFDEGASGCLIAAPLAEDSNAYNVDAGTSCVGSNVDTDLRNQTVLFGGLGPHGGSTETIDLMANSPGVDLVPTSQCLKLDGVTALTTDQRGAGFPRPDGTACEAGSFEVADTDDDNDGVLDVNDSCPSVPGPASNNGCPAPASTTTTESAECEPLRQKIKKLSKKIKKEEDPVVKAKLKKKRRTARSQLAALGCSP